MSDADSTLPSRRSREERRGYKIVRTEEEDGFRLLAENVRGYAIYLLDEAGRVMTWNTGAELIHGYTSDEILQRDFSVFFSTKDISKGLPELALRTARSEGRFATEGWRLRKDRSQFWANVVLTALRTDDGRPCGYAEITRDETERKCADDLYAAVIGSMRSHIAVIDRNGRIVMVNDAWNRFALENGVSSLDKVGVGVNYLDISRRAAKSIEWARQALEGLETILHGRANELTLEYPCPSPDVDRWFVLSATPWKPGGGAVVAHFDITERVLAERKLKDSEQHYKALIENEVDVVTILETDGTIRFESPALERILGYRPDELIGKNAFDFIHKEDLPPVQREMARMLGSTEASRPVEFRFRHKDGSWRVMESVARNLLDNPAVKGVIVNSRDITARRETEAELRRKEAALESSHEQLRALTGRLLEAEERERRRLSRELHDDVNQKLAALAVDAGMLAKSLPHSPLEKIQKDLRTLQTRVAKISEEVRTLAYQLHPSILDDLGLPVALRSYCQDFSAREQVEVEFRHRNMHNPVSPEIASCLYRVAQEGLRNIAKHSGGKRASVSLSRKKGEITLTIQDTGVGFDPESVKAHRSLGLTSMTERARLVGGELQIISAPKKGTTLWLSVPLEANSK